MNNQSENKHPFEDMFDKLGELVNYIQKNINKPIYDNQLTPEVQKKLEKLENDVNEFKKISDQIVLLSQVPKEEMKNRLTGASEDLSPEGRRLLERGNALKKQVQEMQGGSIDEESIEDRLPDFNKENEADKKTSSSRRRRKFKGLDGGPDWKRL